MCRTLTPIDWKLVDQMALAGSSGIEIAGALGIDSDTFYRRFKDQHNMAFAAYSPSRKMGGAGMVRLKQFQSAMRGNAQMLKLLGEEMLGQGKTGECEGSDIRDIITLKEAFNALSEKHSKLLSALLDRGISIDGISIEQPLPHQGRPGEQDQVSDELGSTNTMEREA